MSVNKAILLGRLGHDPDLKSLPSGQAVCNFSIATDEKWTDKYGQRQEKTEWHRITCYGKTAELAGQYLKKGREVFVEGKITTREWKDKNGQKRLTTEIQCEKLTFVGGGQRSEDHDGGGQQEQRPGPPPRQPAGVNYGGVPASAQGLGGFGGFGGDDDIPF